MLGGNLTVYHSFVCLLSIEYENVLTSASSPINTLLLTNGHFRKHTAIFVSEANTRVPSATQLKFPSQQKDYRRPS